MSSYRILHNISVTNIVLDDIKAWCSGKKIESWKLTRFDKVFCKEGILLPDLDKTFKNIGFSLSEFARCAFNNKYTVASVVS